jgi:pimeloyl-ACP methyl ester carboxylesterase
MATFVLVHGGSMSTDTWNRLAGREDYPPGGELGGKYWDGTVAALSSRGHRVFAPTLGDEHECTLTDHIRQIGTLVADHDLRDVILVGHSYGGFVITGVADRMAERIRRLVYLDSGLPDPGQSLFDLLNLGASRAKNPVPAMPDPSPPYVEPIRFDPAKIERLPKTYIRCTKSEFIDITLLSKEKIDAAKGGWTFFEIPSSPVPMADMPDEWYRILLDAADH